MPPALCVKNLLEVLESYHGRDKVLRTLQYTFLSLTGYYKGRSAERLKILAENFGECRTILRLFDDLPMLSWSLSYGLGRKEPDKFLRCIGVVCNMVDQLYYPLEHVAWAADKKILSIDSSKWWTMATAAWAISLYLEIMSSIRSIVIIRKKKDLLLKGLILSSSSQISDFQKLQYSHIITILQKGFDFINAIHWLPNGFLWSGKLEEWHTGIFGLISSLLNIYKSAMLTIS